MTPQFRINLLHALGLLDDKLAASVTGTSEQFLRVLQPGGDGLEQCVEL